VADQRADVHAEPLTDRAHVLRERLPVPGHAGLQDVHRDRLDVREHPGQLLARLGLDRRERERAVADDDRRGAVMAGIGAERIPHDLRVVVAVVVDEARRDDPPVRFDGLTRGSAEPSQLDDLSLRDADVAVEGGPAGSVDDASVLDEEVVGHLVAPFAGTTVAGTSLEDTWEGAVLPPRFSRPGGKPGHGGDGSSEASPGIERVFPQACRGSCESACGWGSSGKRYGAAGRESRKGGG